MAKEKKRGFFSWLGFGKEEETQQPAETPEQQPEDPALAQAETDAAHTVELTEQLAEAQREAPAHAVDEHIAAEPEAEQIVQKAQDAEIIAPLEEIIPEEEPELAPQPIEEEIVPEALPEEEQPLDDEELAALALAEAPQDEAAEEIAAEDEVQDTVSDLPLAAAPIVSQEQERPTKEGFFARLKRSLVKTRQNLGSGFISLFLSLIHI